MTITDWPRDERPRERLLVQGGDALSDAELIAVVMRSGDGRRDAVELGRCLLAQHGSLRELIGATNPSESATGTIRDLFGASLQNNAVHASANPDDAARELGLIFG